MSLTLVRALDRILGLGRVVALGAILIELGFGTSLTLGTLNELYLYHLLVGALGLPLGIFLVWVFAFPEVSEPSVKFGVWCLHVVE